MKKPIRKIIWIIITILISSLLSVVVTIYLTPFWRWIEASTGIESIGHSGPAEWCYIFMFVLFISIFIVAFSVNRRGKKKM